MQKEYDIAVDYATLADVEAELISIGRKLMVASNRMLTAIQMSEVFLAGNQFEQAKNVTSKCIQATNLTEENIDKTIRFVRQLMSNLEEYDRCKYQM